MPHGFDIVVLWPGLAIARRFRGSDRHSVLSMAPVEPLLDPEASFKAPQANIAPVTVADMAVMQARSRAAPSRIHVPAIHRDILPGDKIALGAGKENQGAEQVFRLFVALNGATGHGARLRRAVTCTASLTH